MEHLRLQHLDMLIIHLYKKYIFLNIYIQTFIRSEGEDIGSRSGFTQKPYGCTA